MLTNIWQIPVCNILGLDRSVVRSLNLTCLLLYNSCIIFSHDGANSCLQASLQSLLSVLSILPFLWLMRIPAKKFKRLKGKSQTGMMQRPLALYEHRSEGSGNGNFKAQTLNNAAKSIASLRSMGPVKSGKMVRTKWTSVCYLTPLQCIFVLIRD